MIVPEKDPAGVPQLSDFEHDALREMESRIDAELDARDGHEARIGLPELTNMSPMTMRALVAMYEGIGYEFSVTIKRRQ